MPWCRGDDLQRPFDHFAPSRGDAFHGPGGGHRRLYPDAESGGESRGREASWLPFPLNESGTAPSAHSPAGLWGVLDQPSRAPRASPSAQPATPAFSPPPNSAPLPGPHLPPPHPTWLWRIPQREPGAACPRGPVRGI